MREPIATKGIVLRETSIGEADKMMTLLTPKYGKLSVFVKGAKRLKSPYFVPTQLYSYSEYVLLKSGEHYSIKECTLLESFFNLRNSLSGLSLASYISDIACDIATDEGAYEELTRLVLNCFWAIANKSKSQKLIKSVFEIRSVSLAGFMPNLVGCDECGTHISDVYYFDISNGIFRCNDCFHKNEEGDSYELSKVNENEGLYEESREIFPMTPDVFVTMRYVLYSQLEKIMSFEISKEAMEDFSRVCEKYAIYHLEREFKTLDFYKTVAEE